MNMCKKPMLKILLFCLFINFGYLFAQESYFVSNLGNNSNNGLSENTAFQSLNYALNVVKTNQIYRIIILDNIQENIDVENLGANLVTI